MLRSIHQLCRVCMRKCNNHKVTLLDTYSRDKEHVTISYLTAYNECTHLQAIPGADELPEWLCSNCSHDLQISFEFCCKAKDTDAKLRKQLVTCKQSQQQGEEVQRAATPSEFELPELNGADGYLKFGAELGDTFILDETGYAKDPLEDTDDEEQECELLSTIPIESGLAVPSVGATNDSYDSEDDKPLKELLNSENNATQIEANSVLPKAEEFDNFKTSDTQISLDSIPKPNLYDDDDEFMVCDDYAKSNLNESVFSPEAQIFPKGRFKCEICCKTYFTPVGLKSHFEVHLPKKATTKKKRMRRKQINTNEDNKFTTLDTEVASIAVPTSHQEIVNKTPEKEGKQHVQTLDIPNIETKQRKKQQPKPKKMFPCNVCGKHMISASKLRYHMVMHTGEKDYLCTMCPKAYSTIYALKHHIRTHTGERPYECKFCGDKFLRPTTLKSHQRRHTGERPYGCDVCGKRFIQHSSMTTHMRLNHMEKTIKCPHCNKKYARQTDLNTHLLSHTGDKPYPCQLCPSRFVRQANLNKHMNQQHSGKGTGATGSKRIIINTAHIIENVEGTKDSSVIDESIKNQLDVDLITNYDYMSVNYTEKMADSQNSNTYSTSMDTEQIEKDLSRWHWQNN